MCGIFRNALSRSSDQCHGVSFLVRRRKGSMIAENLGRNLSSILVSKMWRILLRNKLSAFY